ncbi:McrC family protein [Gimesia aquarii]|uniref:5-methylcytosine-specific restriction enzyme subunit McrC n=1 Tax=Gimesia aquarii TaxID=2527964 RepID=A0A517WV05_9PLAN|nr:restriction endonuclease [Gimesia aquarii]QDU09062.1 5-methylcytosine-specific restriction enzyme subunit McrC [Gimesia aquarii]
MSQDLVTITLSEWETLTPENYPALAGISFDLSIESRRVVNDLNSSQKLKLTELRDGIEISSFSHVGRIRVGQLQITILPKLKTSSLLRLLRYAFGFRRLNLISESAHLYDRCGFEDLLISQLNAEAQELISRGLRKSYVRVDDRLASPRGRIDINRLALDGGTITATLACQHYPRVEDTFINQLLMAGLRFAGRLASLVDLRRECRKLASLMEGQVSAVKLDSNIFDRYERERNRLTAAYHPAVSIIRLLFEGQGIALEGRQNTQLLHGFMFDMNTFFQTLLSRFLSDNLSDYTVRDEHGLKGMMRYHPGFNPQGKPAPTPRPDYAIMSQNQVVTLLDAKYRDLWEKPLPSKMLYQLVIYAISQTESPRSAILYPTTDALAKESRINVSDPVFGKHMGQVCLRPVNLNRIEELVSAETAAARRERAAMASRLVFVE